MRFDVKNLKPISMNNIKLEQFYDEAKGNKWFLYFTVFCRVVLALAFIISGIVKIKEGIK